MIGMACAVSYYKFVFHWDRIDQSRMSHHNGVCAETCIRPGMLKAKMRWHRPRPIYSYRIDLQSIHCQGENKRFALTSDLDEFNFRSRNQDETNDKKAKMCESYSFAFKTKNVVVVDLSRDLREQIKFEYCTNMPARNVCLRLQFFFTSLLLSWAALGAVLRR